jgi:hypothetical protein
MASTTKSLRSSTANKRPTTAIADGQIALNTNAASPGLYFKDSAGASIIKIGPVHVGTTAPNVSPGAGGSAGNSTGEAWLDTSLTPNGWKVWTGAAWLNATPAGSATVQGLLELATDGETQAGSDTARAVTPAGLQSKMSDSVSTTSSTTIASSTAVKSAYDLANAALPKSGGTVTGNLEIGTSGSLTFEGATADAFETTLAVVDPTADRTITLPNATGTVVLDNNAQTVQFGLGAVGTPSITFSGDTNTGIYSPAADTLAFAEGGVEAMRIDSSGRVGIGTTSPGYALHVSSSSTTDIFIGSGADDTRLYFTDTNRSIRGVSGGALTFQTGAAERIRIDSSGRLLVGTSSTSANTTALFQGYGGVPTGPGHVRIATGTSFPADGANLGLVLFSDSEHTNCAFISADRDGGTWSASSKPTRLVFSTTADGAASPTERMRITSAGNVGIGTTSPQAYSGYTVATVDNATNGGVVSLRKNGTAYLNLYTNTGFGVIEGVGIGTGLQFLANNAERARIDSSGRLLVGTSSALLLGSALANYAVNIETLVGGGVLNHCIGATRHGGTVPEAGQKLTLARSRGTTIGSVTLVANNDQLGALDFAGADGTDFGTTAAQIVCEVDGTPGANDMPGRLVFSTTADGSASPTERMRISNTGAINHFSSADGFVERLSAAAGTTDLLYAGVHSSTGFNGTICYVVYSNGNVQNTNNSYGAYSDLKLKENIVDANSQWDDLKDLKVRNYNLKEGQTHTQIGLVAQEVELVSPGLVYESPDRDEEGNDLGTVTKSVNYSVLYMKAVKALQEAMERIETLEARLTAAGIE